MWQACGRYPTVRRASRATPEYTSETTLYDLAKDEIVWTATLRTSERENLNTAVKLYVWA